MYRAEGASSSELWAICAAHIDDLASQRTAKARGTCLAADICKERLTFDADGRPHRRHANVVGWPAGGSKDILKNMQQKIAGAMRLELRPTGKSAD